MIHPFFAQCVMCYRTAAAQSVERSRVFGYGILILAIPPALVISGILLLAWFRSRQKASAVGNPAGNTAYSRARNCLYKPLL